MENLQDIPKFLCSELSRQADEQLFGTISRYDVWFLLEYDGYWGYKALPESDLSAPVKARLNSLLDTTPNANLLFIKQTNRKPRAGIAFYVALTREFDPKLYHFTLNTYDDLLTLDIPAVIAGTPVYSSHLTGDSLFTVCTNGKRDQCCAKYGVSVYNTLARAAGEAVWQCTHIGGHRFAATLVCFPQGVGYGRVYESEVETLIEAQRSGRIYLEKYRGRSCYSRTDQAAEYFLRAQTGLRDFDRFRLIGSEELTGDQVAIDFADVTSGAHHRVLLQKALSAWANYESCSATDRKPVIQHQLIRHEVLART